MYKLLIIDDEIEERKIMYKTIYGDFFELTQISNDKTEIVDTLKKRLFDGIVLDSTLKSGMVDIKVKQCIENFEGPVILVSDKREFDDSDRDDEQICDCISLRPILNCMEELVNEKNEQKRERILSIKDGIVKDIQNRTRALINKKCGYSDKEKNKKLSICHIADLQFGDPAASVFDLELFFTRLTTYLRDREPKPDLIVIAGDIVFSGKKSEYEIAENNIKTFLKVLYGEEYYKHLLLVPGNHDYDYSTCLIDDNTSEQSNEEIVDNTLTPKNFLRFSAPDSANYYFCKFAYHLTRNTSYWEIPLKIENNQLMPYGYRTLGISNASQYQALDKENKKKRYLFETKGLDVEQATARIQPPTIVVGHISPRDLGYKDVCNATGIRCNKNYEKQCQEDEQCKKWVTSKLFMDAYNAVIYLYGHKHFASCEITEDRKQLFIAAGTPSGLKNEMTFNIIEIEDGADVDKLTLIVNDVGSEKISMVQCEKYTYNKMDKTWEKDEELSSQ